MEVQKIWIRIRKCCKLKIENRQKMIYLTVDYSKAAELSRTRQWKYI